jgi:hypothetical protein
MGLACAFPSIIEKKHRAGMVFAKKTNLLLESFNYLSATYRTGYDSNMNESDRSQP